ncbi:A-kinase anchor protein 5 [Gastrophryne carolinensis]
MSLSKANASKEKTEPGKGPNDPVAKYFKGYSSMVFLRKGKHKRRPSRGNPINLSREIQESEKKSSNASSRKCEVLGLEEVSNEFTCDSALVETYHLNTTKKAKFSFRKLDDGTFALETKRPNECDESGPAKRSSKKRQKKARHSHKPLKICFKKRSKALRKTSNDDRGLEGSTSANAEDVACAAANQQDIQPTGRTWATFKRLVTRRSNKRSSLKRQSQLSARHLETNGGQRKRFSKLRIPCMKFSRSKRASNSALTTEDPTCAARSSEPETEAENERSDEALAAKYRLQRSLEIENGNIDNCPKNDDDVGETRPRDGQNLGQDFSQDLSQNHSQDFSLSQDLSQDLGLSQDFSQDLGLSQDLNQDLGLSQNFSQDLGLSQNHSQDLSQDFSLNQDVGQESTVQTIDLSSRCPIIRLELIADDSGDLNDLQSFPEANGPLADNEGPTPDTNHLEGGDDSDCEGPSGSRHVSAILDPNSDLYEFLLMRTAASLVSKVIESSIQQIQRENTLLNRGPCSSGHRFYV